MKLYELLQNMKVGEIREIKGIESIPEGTIVQCVLSDKNCTHDSDQCIYRKFKIAEFCSACDCVPSKRKDKVWVCYIDITSKMDSIVKIKLGKEMEKSDVAINLDKYGNYNIILDGVQYQIDKEKIKELCKPVLPTSFDEVDKEYDLHRCCVEAYAPYTSQLATLSQLLYLRDIYRQGWTPNWNDNNFKYGISVQYNQLAKNMQFGINNTFSFQSKELRDKFLENFKDMLEKIKDLI